MGDLMITQTGKTLFTEAHDGKEVFAQPYSHNDQKKVMLINDNGWQLATLETGPKVQQLFNDKSAAVKLFYDPEAWNAVAFKATDLGQRAVEAIKVAEHKPSLMSRLRDGAIAVKDRIVQHPRASLLALTCVVAYAANFAFTMYYTLPAQLFNQTDFNATQMECDGICSSIDPTPAPGGWFSGITNHLPNVSGWWS